MLTPRISLEQWRALVAVVEAGGYAQAAHALHKTQSSIACAVQQLESQLDVEAFAIAGPGTLRLAAIIREDVAERCSRSAAQPVKTRREPSVARA